MRLPALARLGDRLNNGFRDRAIRTVLPWMLGGSWASQTTRFEIAEALGVHVLPVHFYSPVPRVSTLDDSLWDRVYDAGWDLDPAGQLRWLDRLAPWAAEMVDTPAQPLPGQPFTYYWNNPMFGAMDAVVYHALIRELRPQRVLEVGSGYSTMVATRAASQNGSTRVDCIEPFPMEALIQGEAALGRLIRTPVQQVPLEEFEALEAGDILFIDSTHVSKIGSDVNYLILKVLPRLKPGVFIHVHDIFLPWDYPKRWVKDLRLFWNEQYLILAFLMFNTAFRVVLADAYLGRAHPDAVRRAFPIVDKVSQVGGGSLWLERSD